MGQEGQRGQGRGEGAYLTPAGPLAVQLVAAMINGQQTDKSTLSLLLSLHKHAANAAPHQCTEKK